MYQMPIKAIKSILLKEHESFIQALRRDIPLHDYNAYMARLADEKIRRIINSIETYENCEDFIHDSRRMSLQEWIESL